MTKTALILAGHGSHVSPNTAGVVWPYVDQLRAWGVADEITACFWKEQPAFNQALDAIIADHVVVVPVFTAQGYFSKTVIPTEMGLDGPITKRDGRIIHYTPTLGEHPAMRDAVQRLVAETLKTEQLNPKTVAVAVIGHGTPRNPNSRDAAREQADLLRQQNVVAEVVAVYLDDAPFIPSVYETTQATNIIALPYFLASGSHTTVDVPRELGIEFGDAPATVKGRRVYYTSPIGMDEDICRMILDLARKSGLPFAVNTEGRQHGTPQAGVGQLTDAVRQQNEIQFGELTLTPSAVAPSVNNSNPSTLNSLPDLRKTVRENPFRPLATSTDLPDGWRYAVDAPDDITAIVETVYPGAVADWAANLRDVFQPETLQTTIQRQTGMFRKIQNLTEATIEQNIEDVCGKCVRHPTWFYARTTKGEIPCKSPCNWWLSETLKGAS
jgi:sirohydrochlorin cobaltochelatase